MRNLPNTSANFADTLRKIAAFIVMLILLGLAFMFSMVVIAVILVAGAIVWAYLWWKTRELRKQMRDFPPRGVVMEDDAVESEVIMGEVIEGEAIRVDDSHPKR